MENCSIPYVKKKNYIVKGFKVCKLFYSSNLKNDPLFVEMSSDWYYRQYNIKLFKSCSLFLSTIK